MDRQVERRAMTGMCDPCLQETVKDILLGGTNTSVLAFIVTHDVQDSISIVTQDVQDSIDIVTQDVQDSIFIVTQDVQDY